MDLVVQDSSLKDKVAVRIAGAGGSESLTYHKLRQRIDSIAAALIRNGVSPGQFVAVYQETTPDWICSMLAIMKIGTVYVPLDPGTPPERLAMIVSDCRPAALLIDSTVEHMFDVSTVINVSHLGNDHESGDGEIPTFAAADAPALVLYTSGTTGRPKGIVLKHSSFVNEVEVSAKVYGLGSDVVVLQQSALGFDMSVLQIFLALALGGTLCLVPREFRGDATAISDFIVAHNVSYTCATPTEYNSWLRHGNRDALRSSSWRVALSGGEPVTQQLLRAFWDLGKHDSLRLFNGYGPTETTCCSTKVELSYRNGGELAYTGYPTIPAGPASPNESIYILDEQLRPLPIGLPGEIVVGGAGVASGYLGNKELTEEMFVPNVFAPQDYVQRGWTTMYRTRDRGRLHPDGMVTVEGRIGDDTQVKLRGVRIDLQDIEQTIIQCSSGAVTEAVATVRSAAGGNGDAPDSKFIVAHVVLAPDFRDETEGQHGYLSRLVSTLPLPQSVRPSALVPIDEMPRTVSAKVDRRAVAALPVTLSSPGSDESNTRAELQPLTETEGCVKAIWEQVLSGNELMDWTKITTTSDFFHVGGTSMLLLEVRSLVEQQLGVSVPLIQLIEHSTLGAMARLLRGRADEVEPVDWEAEALPSPDVLQTRPGEVPLPGYLAAPPRPKPQVVVLTGAGGNLGRAILDRLLDEPSISKVICLAMRRIESRVASGVLPQPSKRVSYLPGDLRHARLGLSPSDWASVAAEADAVVHVAADVSHRKTYATLRASNVDSTQELARLCLARRIPLHFVSSVEVALLGGSDGAQSVATFAEESVRDAGIVPSQADARGRGYAASKWVCERLLENLAASSGLRAWIHRPSLITLPQGADEAAVYVGRPDAPLLLSVLYFSRLLRALPELPSRVGGILDSVSVEHVADDVVGAVLGGGNDHGKAAGEVRYVHHTGDVEVPLDKLKEHLEAEHGGAFERLPLREWVAKARNEGMHALVATALETFESENKALHFPRYLRGAREFGSR